jgi:transaldolase
MKFFVDSADPDEIRSCVARGIIDGVSIRAAPGTPDWPALVRAICQVAKGPVSAEVTGEDRDQLLEEARALGRVSPNIVVRLPLSDSGLQAVRACAEEGISTHVTGCGSPLSAIRAAQAGASYLSALGGRHGEMAPEGSDLIRKIVATYKTYQIATTILVTSVDSANQVFEAALAGAQIVTVPYAILQRLGERPP